MTADLNFWRTVEPQDLFRAVAHEENRTFVISVLRALTPDPVWTKRTIIQVELSWIETRCFVSWLARELQPKAYLEVGVRRGFTMAMVASRCPQVEIYGFDMWLPNYGDVHNPGPKFVQSEMERVGYKRKVNLISGNSHKRLPAFFRSSAASFWDRVILNWKFKQRPPGFDLITIDGDHSLLGAYQDLLDTMVHCAVGGVIVFDDIAPDLSTLNPEAARSEKGEDPHGWGDLLGLWRAIQQTYDNFRYFEYVGNPPGVGIAVRLK